MARRGAAMLGNGLAMARRALPCNGLAWPRGFQAMATSNDGKSPVTGNDQQLPTTCDWQRDIKIGTSNYQRPADANDCQLSKTPDIRIGNKLINVSWSMNSASKRPHGCRLSVTQNAKPVEKYKFEQFMIFSRSYQFSRIFPFRLTTGTL